MFRKTTQNDQSNKITRIPRLPQVKSFRRLLIKAHRVKLKAKYIGTFLLILFLVFCSSSITLRPKNRQRVKHAAQSKELTDSRFEFLTPQALCPSIRDTATLESLCNELSALCNEKKKHQKIGTKYHTSISVFNYEIPDGFHAWIVVYDAVFISQPFFLLFLLQR